MAHGGRDCEHHHPPGSCRAGLRRAQPADTPRNRRGGNRDPVLAIAHFQRALGRHGAPLPGRGTEVSRDSGAARSICPGADHLFPVSVGAPAQRIVLAVDLLDRRRVAHRCDLAAPHVLGAPSWMAARPALCGTHLGPGAAGRRSALAVLPALRCAAVAVALGTRQRAVGAQRYHEPGRHLGARALRRNRLSRAIRRRHAAGGGALLARTGSARHRRARLAQHRALSRERGILTPGVRRIRIP